MRLVTTIIFCVLSTLAVASDLQRSGTAAAEAQSGGASQIGAAMAGDALQCDRSVIVENADAAAAIRARAQSDADANAGKLADLPGVAESSVKELAGAYSVDEQLLKRAYFSEACQRLAEKGISAVELQGTLNRLAETLSLTYPAPAAQAAASPAEPAAPASSEAQAPATETATPGSETPAAVEPASPTPEAAPAQSAEAPAAPSTEKPAMSADAPASAETPVAAAQTPIVPEPVIVPSTTEPPADLRAPEAAAAPPQTAEAPAASSSSEPATELKTEAPASPPSAETPAPAATETSGQAAAPAPEAEAQQSAEAPIAAPTEAPVIAQPAPSPAGGEPQQSAEAPAAAPPETPPAAAAAPTEQQPAPAPVGAEPQQSAEAPAATPAETAPATPSAPSAEVRTAEAPAPPPQAETAPPAEAPAAPPAAPAPAAEERAEAPAAQPTPAPLVATPRAEAPLPSEYPGADDAQPAAPPAPPAAPATGGEKTAKKARIGGAGSAGNLGEEQCRALGVLENCPDLNAVLDQLLEKPLEYNHPNTMLLGRKTEITLVLRTDWEGKDMPTEVSEELKGLPGEVKQGISKITRVMSAELTGRDFEIAPSTRQERTIVPPQPVSWNWQVSPTETGISKPLKLRLYAHLQGAEGTMPPILVKTLDATINVDVTTWDWVVNQARTLEPIYAIGAALLGLLTAILTYFLTRKRVAAYSGGPSEAAGTRDSGPVIGDLDQSATDRRSGLSTSKPEVPTAPPKVEGGGSGGPDGGSSS